MPSWCAAASSGVLLPAVDAIAARLDALARAHAGPRDALAHARAAGHADHARQGNGERRLAAEARPARRRRRRDDGQGERRHRQLQRARRRRARHGLARASRAGS